MYGVNGYLFVIPASWADANVGGRYPATGRMRDCCQARYFRAMNSSAPSSSLASSMMRSTK
jgi:hypothetical protein